MSRFMPVKKSDYYKVEDGKISRLRDNCPKCGPGTFLAVHSDRKSCGNCGYTQSND